MKLQQNGCSMHGDEVSTGGMAKKMEPTIVFRVQGSGLRVRGSS